MNPFRRRVRHDRRGASAVEFALLAPMLLMLLVGVGEMVLYLRTWMKVESTAAELANNAAQAPRLTTADVAALFDSAQTIAGPDIDVTRFDGTTIISLFDRFSNKNRLVWRCRKGNTALLSRFTPNAGGDYVLPNNFRIPDGQTLLVTEVFHLRDPLILGPGVVALVPALGALRDQRSQALVRPRQGSLSEVPVCPV